MSPAVSSRRTSHTPMTRRDLHAGARPQVSQAMARRPHGVVAGAALARYLDARGFLRELSALPGYDGSVLVVDRDAVTLCDRRLVAHLAADEPSENAALVSRLYIEDMSGRWCRPVRPEDLQIAPFATQEDEVQADVECQRGRLEDHDGNTYSLESLQGERSTLQLRWCRRCAQECKQATLREVIGSLEAYEPARMLTERAIASHREDPSVSTTRLRCELERLSSSPVVLNRGLREAVLKTIDREGTSMSEIALRCGVAKRDRRGNLSGETSWLARRVGLMPEGGEKTITPWIHGEVLGTIARKGLGLTPREVELQ
jgi:hypothetical protein